MEPKEITVIVHEGKDLPVRKRGKNKYHVVFGVGSCKFKTENENDDGGNPSWMTESTVELSNSSLPLILVVKDKDEVLGQVSVPLNTLPNARASHKMVKAALQPHKKCQSPKGTLTYEAWISKYGPKNLTLQLPESPKIGTLGKIRDTLNKSPLLARKKFQHSNSSDTNNVSPNIKKRRNSRSLSDLSKLHEEKNSGETFLGVNPILSRARANSYFNVQVNGADINRPFSTQSTGPNITKITPDRVSSAGDTKICIEGSNLGEDHDDVIGLSLCGANCLKTLEYVSSCKLYCTTKPWKSCTGYIGLETRSGGRARSVVQLTFEDDPTGGGVHEINTTPSGKLCVTAQSETVPQTSPRSPRKTGFISRLTNSENKDQHLVEQIRTLESRNEELEEGVRSLQMENKGLREENETMKLYVDHLVARVMEECPEALCSTNNSRRTSYAKTRTITL